MKAHVRGSYIQKTYIAGATIEIMKTYSTRYGKKIPREKNQGPSPEAVEKYNEKLSEDTLRRSINENFTYRDYHLVLTYGAGECPKPPEAKKQLARFLRRLRTEYRKRGADLKYIAVTEYEGKRIHHHLIINRLDDALLAECWEYGRPHITPLDATGDYAALAHYLIKETGRTYRDKQGFGRRWSRSKNLRKVEPFVAVIPARAWQKKPEVPKKWKNEYILVVDSIREGVSEVTGHKYQSFRLVRINGARGGPVSQSNASLGITKLSLLTEVSAVDREEFAEKNDLAGMSVRDIKALLEEKKQFGEQVSFLTGQVETLKEQVAAALPEDRADNLRRELEEAEGESETLRRELADLKSRPIEVAVAEPSAGEIEKFKAAARKEFDAEQKKLLKEEREKAAAKAKKEAEKEIAAAREEAAARAKEDIQAALGRVEQEKAEAIARADKLAKELEVSADADFIAANHFFQEWDEYFAKLMNVVGKIQASDAAKAEKLKKAIGKRVELMNEQIKE